MKKTKKVNGTPGTKVITKVVNIPIMESKAQKKRAALKEKVEEERKQTETPKELHNKGEVEFVAGTTKAPKLMRNGAPIAPIYEDTLTNLGIIGEGKENSGNTLTGTFVAANKDPNTVSTTLSSLGNAVPAYSDKKLNMRMRNDIESVKRMCRDFARGNLFRFTKFWDESLNMADPRKEGLPYHLSRNILMEREAILDGWSFYSKILQRAHTDHRNNVIKKIKQIYQGTCDCQSLMHATFLKLTLIKL